MEYLKNLYHRIFGDFFINSLNSEFDLNYTCNVFLTKNMTIIEIDRGWEGIPESLVIQLIICLFLISPFLIFRYLARYYYHHHHHHHPNNISNENNNDTNWIQFIYGNRDIKKKILIHLNKNFHSIEVYFKNKNISIPNILPNHLTMCKYLFINNKNISNNNINNNINGNTNKHKRTNSTTYGSTSSTSSSSSASSTITNNNMNNNNKLLLSSPSSSSMINLQQQQQQQQNNDNHSSTSTTSTTITEILIIDNNDTLNLKETEFPSEQLLTSSKQILIENKKRQKQQQQQQNIINFNNQNQNENNQNNNNEEKIFKIENIFKNLLNINDDDILKNKGHDAYQYLLFQRYIIIFLFILSFVTIVIILPINVQGNNVGKAFARTSISNVPHESNLYWAHAICSTFIIIVGVFLMNRFSNELKTDDDLMFCTTLLIRDIPTIKNNNNNDNNDNNLIVKIENYFKKKFPQIQVTGIQLITDTRQLDYLEQSYKNAKNAIKYCENMNKKLKEKNKQQKRQKQRSEQQQQQQQNNNDTTIVIKNEYNNNVNDDNDNDNNIDYIDDYVDDDDDDDNVQYMIRSFNCNKLFNCCCCCCKRQRTNAFDYYTNEKNELQLNIYKELEQISKQTVRSAFITFRTEKMAMEVYKFIKKEQKHSCINNFLLCGDFCINLLNDSNNLNQEFDLKKCLVSYAPYPDDVNWRDIAIDMNLLWLRKIIIFIILFIIFFFLSTPAFLLKIFDIIATKELIKNGILKPNSIITDFMSPFLLMLLAVILPSIVTYACQMIPYKTISDLNHAVMSKVFAFLVMMIIVLPSTGFLSINAMLGAVLASNSDQNKFRWHCLFPVDNGAFFVIYTLQATILGNVAEILRIPELILYIIYTLFLRSSAEYQKARKWVTFDFPFGVSYPRFLLIFTMTIIYSFACPLIAPCGLFYMIGKHIVDRYNIYHVYQPTKINRRIHSSAIMYVHIGLILMQFQLFTVMIIKTQYSHITLFILIILILTMLQFTFFGFHNCFRNSIKSSINRNNYTQKRDFCICSYTPPVLYHLLDDKLF